LGERSGGGGEGDSGTKKGKGRLPHEDSLSGIRFSGRVHLTAGDGD
jgi:hypothetical protein